MPTQVSRRIKFSVRQRGHGTQNCPEVCSEAHSPVPCPRGTTGSRASANKGVGMPLQRRMPTQVSRRITFSAGSVGMAPKTALRFVRRLIAGCHAHAEQREVERLHIKAWA